MVKIKKLVLVMFMKVDINFKWKNKCCFFIIFIISHFCQYLTFYTRRQVLTSRLLLLYRIYLFYVERKSLGKTNRNFANEIAFGYACTPYKIITIVVVFVLPRYTIKYILFYTAILFFSKRFDRKLVLSVFVRNPLFIII